MKHKTLTATQRAPMRFLFAVCTLLLVIGMALPATTDAAAAGPTATPTAVVAKSNSGIR